ncbi:hypothetical protein OJF2_39450 [Aquisphaera giovannonii]|uniref:Uncharacterized protein n=1 Tax=Aquisphaera giovannonii TaxID=406548 RepID=A0A5B9W457_9BACT|nr:hypothetical protein OJF2_39450 [Aquisphaera giovannonii]
MKDGGGEAGSSRMLEPQLDTSPGNLWTCDHPRERVVRTGEASSLRRQPDLRDRPRPAGGASSSPRCPTLLRKLRRKSIRWNTLTAVFDRLRRPRSGEDPPRMARRTRMERGPPAPIRHPCHPCHPCHPWSLKMPATNGAPSWRLPRRNASAWLRSSREPGRRPEPPSGRMAAAGWPGHPRRSARAGTPRAGLASPRATPLPGRRDAPPRPPGLRSGGRGRCEKPRREGVAKPFENRGWVVSG